MDSHDDHGAPKAPTVKKPWPVYVILGVMIIGFIWGLIHKYSGPQENTNNNKSAPSQTEQTAPDITKTYQITVEPGDWVRISNSNSQYSVQTGWDGEDYFYKNDCGQEPILIQKDTKLNMSPCSSIYVKAIDHKIIVLYWYVKN